MATSISGRGGQREGAGRPALDASEKKKMASFKLSPEVLALLDKVSAETRQSKASLVERALMQVYGGQGS